VTSLLRRHLSRRLWRGVHLLAYVSWPVAWLHSIFSSPDMRHGALFLLAVACALVVVIAVGWRLAAAARDLPRAERVGHLMATMHHPMSAMHHRAETQHRAEMHHRVPERTPRP
jgi:DMSO/TMAO reductase YedYZ heme-binding membrane subunit